MTSKIQGTRGQNEGPEVQSAAVAELLDVRAVAALLGACSTRHVFRLADAGRMPKPIKLGGLVRWRRAEVLEWIAAGCPNRDRCGQEKRAGQ